MTPQFSILNGFLKYARISHCLHSCSIITHYYVLREFRLALEYIESYPQRTMHASNALDLSCRMVILCGQRRKKEDILKKVQRICFHFQSCRIFEAVLKILSIFGKGNDDGLVMSHQSAWARLCEDYLERHNVSDLIKRALVRLCIAQPDDPVAFLSHYFQLLEKGEYEFDFDC
ncbi:cAMP-dependent protein kinase type I-alpha regulatory subunit [Trichinella pseudospiralis]|uniref:cAMP-dependent protein kinase type I-alpha regulatory subunit n=1 Tax=Trichinella pseudospiralis TaxID=6337 RepID=A0A0V1K634_TRIPS|nr:cAMP-dependent protein kinase type I-alpha regulatory subunit [Trichinella pseudospiralis]